MFELYILNSFICFSFKYWNHFQYQNHGVNYTSVQLRRYTFARRFRIWLHFRIWARWCKTPFFTKHYDACLLQTNSQWVVLIRGKYVVYFHNLNIFRNLKLQRHLSEKYHSKLTCHLIWVVQLELTQALNIDYP